MIKTPVQALAMSARDQLAFRGTARDAAGMPCAAFEPNPFVRVKCRLCQRPIGDHASQAVRDADIVIAVEAEQRKSPANAVWPDEGSACGKVYVGGFSAASAEFCRTERIARIVNAAKGLDTMFPSWAKSVAELEKSTSILRLGWIDEYSQKPWREPPWDQLVEAIHFIDEAVQQGESVLVHCAMGKSRSGAVAVAYVMAKMGLSAPDALQLVRSRRLTIEPNPGFMYQLGEFGKSAAFASLRTALHTRTTGAAGETE
eukprot:TRINITY_DN244_c0_g2_i1.p1 TRINITY_DN244_c0_g2~~TRINITY_DN244_c0_g2_i1.p1  ORF type:complete len:258 (+),score=38.98 TRINITY_DN244_c0_g2_i1:130-903(+)